MSWRVAECLITLRDEIDHEWPNRNRASDGTIGDARHQAGWESSDHNPFITDRNGVGVVRALDITHDPSAGPDCNRLAAHLRELGAGGDRRVLYVIWDRRICSATPKTGYPPWTWRPYDGSNPHTAHLHLSTSTEQAVYDSERPWGVSDLDMPSAEEIARATVRELRAEPIPAEGGETPERWRWDRHVRHNTVRLRQLHAWAGAHDRALDRMAEAVAALAAGQRIDTERLVTDVRAAAEAGARAALETGVVDVDITVHDRQEPA